MTARGSLTVLFEPPFWIGLCERSEQGRYEVCRVVFGAQPREAEVYAFVLRCWDKLRFGPAVREEQYGEKRANPKRVQRQVSALLQQRGMSTRAQQALQRQREEEKSERKAGSRQRRQAEQERRYALRTEKKKAKHRGR